MRALRPPPPAPRRRRLDARGATAVEFAMLATPFIFMIFAIIQLSLHFMVQVTLDNATALAARQLRTGTVQADGANDTTGQANFAKSICSNMSWLAGQCVNNQTLVVDVRPLGTYSTAVGAPTINSDGSGSNTCYYSGSAGTPVELRAYYRWNAALPNMVGYSGPQEVQSTEVFQVEPNGQTNSTTQQCSTT